MAARGSRRRIDLGRINDRYFLTTASLGLSVQITEALTSETKRRWSSGMTLVPALRRGKHGSKGSVEALRSPEFDIQTIVPHEINVDGEICLETPARFRVIPGPLEVFALQDAPA